MTIEDLKEYKKLFRETQYWQWMLETELAKSETKAPKLSGMPRARSISDPTSEHAIRIDQCRLRLRQTINMAQKRLQEIEKFINNIDDPMLKIIIYGRYINCLTWQQIAFKVGGGNTADGIRKAHNRFLKKNSDVSALSD